MRNSHVEHPDANAYLPVNVYVRSNALSAISRFLGDSPLRVLLKLVVLSLIVGFVMSAFHWTPWDIAFAIRETLLRIWDMGFAAIGNFLGYILLGAVIVVPAFVILRILNYRR